jgi:hypothetical protein
MNTQHKAEKTQKKAVDSRGRSESARDGGAWRTHAVTDPT